MVRTQIQLTEEQAAVLRKMSAARQQSMAELIRMSIDLFVRGELGASRDAVVERARRAAGRFSSGSADGSRAHDQHLAEAVGSCAAGPRRPES